MENKCPSCHSTNIRNDSIRNNNGIIGPGCRSWVVEEKYSCNDCGVYFKPVTERYLNLAIAGHGKPERVPAGPRWVKASIDNLPLHKAFWNIEDGFKKDNSFPVRIDGRKYGMGDIYDDRKEGAPDPIYYFVINGEDYYEKNFHRIEWLDEQPSLTMQQEKKLREQAEQFFEDAIRQLNDPERKEEVEGERETYIGVWMRGYRAGEAAPAAGREEDAVAFLAWIQKNDYYYSTHGGGYWYEWNEKEQETFLCNTNNELYKLFKKEAK